MQPLVGRPDPILDDSYGHARGYANIVIARQGKDLLIRPYLTVPSAVQVEICKTYIWLGRPLLIFGI